jgi:glutaminase
MTAHRRLVLIATSALAIGLASASMPRLAAQTPANVQTAVDAAYAKFKDLREGKNADYIPALAKVDPNLFGIAVVTADGKVYTAGDVKTEVSIQSISKVFTMAQVIRSRAWSRSKSGSASMRPAPASIRSSRSRASARSSAAARPK